GLFDIVRWKLPKTVRRRAASSAVLILRSARAARLPQIQARVRASRKMRTARMPRDAALRAAPRHEGGESGGRGPHASRRRGAARAACAEPPRPEERACA